MLVTEEHELIYCVLYRDSIISRVQFRLFRYKLSQFGYINEICKACKDSSEDYFKKQGQDFS